MQTKMDVTQVMQNGTMAIETRMGTARLQPTV